MGLGFNEPKKKCKLAARSLIVLIPKGALIRLLRYLYVAGQGRVVQGPPSCSISFIDTPQAVLMQELLDGILTYCTGQKARYRGDLQPTQVDRLEVVVASECRKVANSQAVLQLLL